LKSPACHATSPLTADTARCNALANLRIDEPQKAAVPVDHCGLPHHLTLAHSMQSLQIELLFGLDRH